MPRLLIAIAAIALVLLCAPAGATSMKATAPEKMMPAGGGEAMRECDKLAMEQKIKMEERARFVKECVAKKMK